MCIEPVLGADVVVAQPKPNAVIPSCFQRRQLPEGVFLLYTKTDMASSTMTYSMRSEIFNTSSLGILRLEPSPTYREALTVKHKSERDFLRCLLSKRKTGLQDLPVEIVSLILGYLPPFEVWRCRAVSRGVRTAGV